MPLHRKHLQRPAHSPPVNIAPQRRSPPPLPRMREPPASGTRRRPVNRDFSDPSYEDVDTKTLKLSPELLHALRDLAPKQRSSRLPHAFAAALLTVAAVVGSSRPVREFVVARLNEYRASATLSLDPPRRTGTR